MPELSARRNIVVIADEAHRSQYGFGGKVNPQTGEMSYGFASNLRDALPPTVASQELQFFLSRMAQDLVETEEPSGPFGAKAVAEIPLDGAAAALANALYDATGVRVRQIPLTPERVWQALRAAEARRSPVEESEAA